ncbi:MAG: hypothetical protein V4539_16520 [Bacteroidota bacterium]
MNEATSIKIRERLYRTLTYLQYFEQVYTYAESQSSTRLAEQSKTISDNKSLPYHEFLAQFGKEFLDEFYNRELFFKFMLIHSVFIQYYSLFEHTLLEWMAIMVDADRSKKIVDIKSKSEIDKARKYLHQMYGVESASNTPDLSLLNDFRKIRNAIVHNDSHLVKHIQSSKKFLRGYECIVRDDTYQFMIRDDKFLKDFLMVVRRYFKAISDEIAPVKKN